jgi:hypothetical protein
VKNLAPTGIFFLGICALFIHYEKVFDSKECNQLEQCVQITNLFLLLQLDVTVGTAGRNIPSA